MSDKALIVQIQPPLLSSTDSEGVVDLLESLAKKNPHIAAPRTTRGGDDSGTYINVKFVSNDLHHLWTTIRKSLFPNSPAGSVLKKGIIVVCQGKAGWKDYVILHHYDPLQGSESLPKRKRRKSSR
jgi:hypothetical protein